MITEKLGLDEKDVKLISLMMDDPQISQSEIAEKLSLSQPSVFVRLQKLRKKGLIESTFGLSFSKTGLFVSRV
ncbi:MAG: winged helix-turn-helix transcriptional regulator, partial [Nanoarchaeota archaeon]|nr:winged helix-turn-helix transcriptional regulator [Nanoarchaeota archaeon]